MGGHSHRDRQECEGFFQRFPCERHFYGSAVDAARNALEDQQAAHVAEPPIAFDEDFPDFVMILLLGVRLLRCRKRRFCIPMRERMTRIEDPDILRIRKEAPILLQQHEICGIVATAFTPLQQGRKEGASRFALFLIHVLRTIVQHPQSSSHFS